MQQLVDRILVCIIAHEMRKNNRATPCSDLFQKITGLYFSVLNHGNLTEWEKQHGYHTQAQRHPLLVTTTITNKEVLSRTNKSNSIIHDSKAICNCQWPIITQQGGSIPLHLFHQDRKSIIQPALCFHSTC